MTRHRLLWKIILIFWLTIISTISANIYITKEIALSEFKSEHFTSKTLLLAQEAVKIYEDEGIRSLRKWYRSTYRIDGLSVVLLNSDFKRIGGRYSNDTKHSEKDTFTKPERHDKHLLNMADQKITSANGEEYILRILPSPALSAKFNPETLHIYRLISTFIIVFIGSLWLYRSIAKPLRVLHEASEKLSMGDFSIRTSPKVGPRKDELGQLAEAFDQMAIKIEALLNNQKQLFRDISHEIRTPLTRQKLAIELAKDSKAPLVFLNKIEHQNNNINALIDNLLTFIKLEDTDLKELEILDLSDIVSHVITEAELDLQTKHINVQSQLEDQCLISGSPMLITRATENILMNAIKYSPISGQINLQCSRHNNIIKFVISDRGQGIPEQDLDHIFKPFYRSDQSRNQQTGGFGLGLAITQKIIQQHHGQIRIKNIQPNGLSLTIEFPLYQAVSI